MGSITRLILAAAVFTTLFVFNVSPASACTCWILEPLEEFDRSTAVFAGQVISIQPPTAVGGIVDQLDPAQITFNVSRVWKGPLVDTLVVKARQDEGVCGYHFSVGSEYLVYASGSEQELWTGLCNRPALLANDGEDLEALEEALTRPTPEPDKETEPERPADEFTADPYPPPGDEFMAYPYPPPAPGPARAFEPGWPGDEFRAGPHSPPVPPNGSQSSSLTWLTPALSALALISGLAILALV